MQKNFLAFARVEALKQDQRAETQENAQKETLDLFKQMVDLKKEQNDMFRALLDRNG